LDAEKIEIAQQYGVIRSLGKLFPYQIDVVLVDGRAGFGFLKQVYTPFKAAFELQYTPYGFAAGASLVWAQVGSIAAENGDRVAPLLKSPGKIRKAAAIATQFLGRIEIGNQQNLQRLHADDGDTERVD
jgi:hypothetical protein